MPQSYGKISSLLPGAGAENAYVPIRVDAFGNPNVLPFGLGRDVLSLGGCYYKAKTPTPGTGVIVNAAAAFTATSGCLSIYNSGTKRIILDYIYLRNTVAGVGYTTLNLLGALDLSTNRFSAGGGGLSAVNVNSESALSSAAVMNFGNITFTAETGAVRRLNCAIMAKISIFSTNEALRLQYLDSTFGYNPVGVSNITLALAMGPVVIGPLDSYTLHSWFNAAPGPAPSFEVEMGYYEI